MAIVYSYPITTPQDSDLLIISRTPSDPDEISNFNITVNALADFITAGVASGTGTTNTIPLWTDGANGTLGDSIISQPATKYIAIAGQEVKFNVGEANTLGTGSQGWNSVVFGQYNNVTAKFSLAAGQRHELTGENDTAALGFGNTASAVQSLATGYLTTASGAQAASFGISTTASGSHAIAAGNETTASGLNAVAFGNNTTASGTNSFAAGANSTVSSGTFNSFAFGSNLDNQANSSLVCGTYNQDLPQYRFAVGTGSSGDRKNGLAVTGSGYIVMTDLGVSTSYANDTEAAAGGVPINGLYRNGNVVQIRLT